MKVHKFSNWENYFIGSAVFIVFIIWKYTVKYNSLPVLVWFYFAYSIYFVLISLCWGSWDGQRVSVKKVLQKESFNTEDISKIEVHYKVRGNATFYFLLKNGKTVSFGRSKSTEKFAKQIAENLGLKIVNPYDE